MKFWQHDETGRTTSADQSPGPRWFEVKAAMPKSITERQRAYRARKAAANLSEVRGIFLPQSMHTALKAHARNLLKPQKRAPGA